MAAAHGLSDVVKGLGQVGYRESLRIQKNSDMLLFVQWKGEGNEGWYSAKIYDYIGSGRPILALANKGGIIDDIITRTSSGFITDNEYGIRQYIAKLYSEFSKNGFVRHDNNGAEVSKETRRLRAGSLAELFDSVSRKRRS